MDLSPLLLPTPAQALAMAEEATSRLAARGLSAEVFLRGGRELSVRHDPVADQWVENSGGTLSATCRVWQDGRCGVTSSEVQGIEELLRLAEEARVLAPEGPLLPLPPSVPARAELGDTLPELSEARARSNALALCAPLAKGNARPQVVLIRQSATWSVVSSPQGTRAADLHPSEQGLLRVETPRGALVDGVAGPIGQELLDMGPLHARLLAALATTAEPGGAPEPGLPWVLRPLAAGPLVSGLGWLLRGDVAEKTPGLLRAVGKKIFPSALTVVDEPSPSSPGNRRSDDEGLPVLPIRFIEGGRLMGFLHSSSSATALAVPPNGRGLRPQGQGAPVPSPVALQVLAGASALPEDRNEFDARLETFTSMARAGRVTLILAGQVVRRGEHVRRIAPIELELPLLETFRQLVAVGPDPAFLPALEGITTPSLVFPPLLGR